MGEVILFQPSVLKRICKNLTVEEVVQFLTAYNRTTLDLPIAFKDRIEKRKLFLPGITPLTLEVYKLIKAKGLNSALLEVVNQGKSKLIPILLKIGADINAKSKIRGETPLIVAVKTNRPKVVSILLNRGANVDDRNDNGNTALLYAVQNGYDSIVKILLKHGADVNVVNNNGDTPRGVADITGHLSTLALLNKAQ